MSMKMMNAAYLVDNAALLSLQEKQDGVEFHCFDMDSKVQTTEGHIPERVSGAAERRDDPPGAHRHQCCGQYPAFG